MYTASGISKLIVKVVRTEHKAAEQEKNGKVFFWTGRANGRKHKQQQKKKLRYDKKCLCGWLTRQLFQRLSSVLKLKRVHNECLWIF